MAGLNGSKTVEFKYYAPKAKKVSVAGTFNKWDAKKLSAKSNSRGTWLAKANLKPGRYEYKFVVDGNWANDPRCTCCVSNAFGTQNCIVEVK